MYVYLIEAVSVGLVKIGFSGDPEARLRDLAGSSPVELWLVGYFKGDLDMEQRLHALFASHHAHHEWFEDCDAIRDFFFAHPTWRELDQGNPVRRSGPRRQARRRGVAYPQC